MAMEKEALDAFIASIPAMSTEKQVKLFIRTREAKAMATKLYDAEQAQFKAIMGTCENLMLATADAQGTTGFKTDLGTTYTAESQRASVADHAAFHAFLDALPPEADRYGFFETRLSQTRIAEYTETTGSPPPGLNIFRERNMRVRKVSEK